MDVARQCNGEHDDHLAEYTRLMTVREGTLGQLKKEFDSLNEAKLQLGKAFVVYIVNHL